MSTTSSARRSFRSGAVAALLLAALPLLRGARAEVIHVPADIPTVAEALAAAQTGDEIVLAAGSYNDTILLDNLHGITLRGQGQVLLGGGDLLTAALTVNDGSELILDNLRIVQPPGLGVFVADSNHITLSRVVVVDAGTDGMVVGEISTVLLDRCRVEGAAQDGIEILFANNATVTRCTVSGVTGNGIVLSEDVTDGSVDRCKVSGAGQHGIALGLADPISGCSATRNVVSGSGANGIRVRGGDNVVRGNRVQDSAGSGIGLLIAAGGLVEDNRLTGDVFGISSQASSVLFRDNRIAKCVAIGLRIQGSDCVLVGNRVMQSGGSAYFFENGFSGTTVLGCKSVHSEGNGFEVAADGLAFTDNLASGSASAGFLVSGTANVFVGNAAVGSGLGGVVDTAGGNTYVANDFGSDG